MASAGTGGCETQDGQQLTSFAIEHVTPMLERADSTSHVYTASDPQNALETDEEQQEPGEDANFDSLAARLKGPPDVPGPAEYTKYTPPWYPNQQRLGEPEHSSSTPQRYQILREWFAKHAEDPYTGEEEKGDLARRTRMNCHQVANWSISTRRRSRKSRAVVEEDDEEQDRWRAVERPAGGEKIAEGEIKLDWEGDGKAGLEKLAPNPVGTDYSRGWDDDWEFLCLSEEEEHKAVGQEATAEQQSAGTLRQA